MIKKNPIPLVPVSWGELIDKLTILDIKRDRLTGEQALANVGREWTALAQIADPVLAHDETARALVVRLKSLNETLWEIEDRIRGKEKAGAFDAEFVELARAVYKRNDERAALKKQLNTHLASGLVEEKSYRPY